MVRIAVPEERRTRAVEDDGRPQGPLRRDDGEPLAMMRTARDLDALVPDREPELRVHGVRARFQRPTAARSVAHADAAGAAEARARLLVGEQHADLRHRRVGKRGAGVVVREDPLPAPTVQRVAVGPPLAHPDTVSPAAAGDDELRPGRCGRCRAEGAENRSYEPPPSHKDGAGYPVTQPVAAALPQPLQIDRARRSRAPVRPRRHARAAVPRRRGSNC